MQHRIYIITNAQNEAYIMVRKARFTLEYLIENAYHGDEVYEKNHPVLNRFIRENAKESLEMTHIDVPVTFEKFSEVLEYRQQIIEQYYTDGFLVLDEKHYELFDRPADTNFAEVLKRVDISAAVKKFGRSQLMYARKTLTVGEFIANYG